MKSMEVHAEQQKTQNKGMQPFSLFHQMLYFLNLKDQVTNEALDHY